jgi:hypothetical protein
MVSTVARVPSHTAPAINQRIEQATEDRLAYYAGHPKQIPTRLRELDREWDIERAIEANASTVGFAGVVLGVAADRRWLALPALVTAFLFQHAVQGWCPPVPVLRRMGFRTADEIAKERYALKAMRGDFGQFAKPRNRLNKSLKAVGLRGKAKKL